MSIRVLGAGLLGAIIGYERELRAKGAGIRTHVLVALGSAMFMIISQYGFAGADRFDAARVAAGVVGGLGFLGGGIIMKTKNHVMGLTTAAGLWVTGSKFGDKEVTVVISSPDQEAIKSAIAGFGKKVADYSLAKMPEGYKAELILRVPKRDYGVNLLNDFSSIPGVQLESMN